MTYFMNSPIFAMCLGWGTAGESGRDHQAGGRPGDRQGPAEGCHLQPPQDQSRQSEGPATVQ